MIDATNITANINNSQCIVEKAYWGHDTFFNVCSGTETEVPWSALNYLVGLGIWAVAVIIGLFLLGALISAIPSRGGDA